MSEYRHDILHNTFSIIAPERITRPNFFYDSKKDDKSSLCPFCKGNENLTPKEIYSIKEEDGNWLVRVVPNLYKALKIEADFTDKKMDSFDNFDGFGAHEVIIDTPKHLTRFEKLNLLEISLWIKTIKQRVDDLSKDLRLRYFSIFKNQGDSSGSTIPHIHTQLIAMELIPQRELEWFRYLYRYYKKNNKNLFAQVIEFEKRENKRVIEETKDFISLAPYGSSFAFEVVILPKFELPNIGKIDEQKSFELAYILKNTLLKLNREIGEFDYNLLVQNPPLNENFQSNEFFGEVDKFFKSHIRIIPRLYKTGGFELQSGVYINPVKPETVCNLLRKNNSE